MSYGRIYFTTPSLPDLLGGLDPTPLNNIKAAERVLRVAIAGEFIGQGVFALQVGLICLSLNLYAGSGTGSYKDFTRP